MHKKKVFSATRSRQGAMAEQAGKTWIKHCLLTGAHAGDRRGAAKDEFLNHSGDGWGVGEWSMSKVRRITKTKTRRLGDVGMAGGVGGWRRSLLAAPQHKYCTG